MTSRFDVRDLPLPGVRLIHRRPVRDERGYFERLYCLSELQAFLPPAGIVQINHTVTAARGVVRGLHFQHPPHAEAKLVTCLHGEIFDVVVDIRRGSPTFLRSHAEILNAADHTTLLVPPGCAHGFQTLSRDCELLYFHTAAYNAGAEAGLNAVDPRLSIAWPHPITERSERDSRHPLLTDAFIGLDV